MFKKALKALPENSEEQEEDFEFLQEIFRGFLRSYSAAQSSYDGEATFNSLLIYPFLEAVANGVTKLLALLITRTRSKLTLITIKECLVRWQF
ncbi:hypothetical protein RO3G_04168 [Rhizopus delemar RA 99-880]|uniref:Uncharacterized protein n=1 Tax=Rhizopus delemar (strain RA 99-880 / ATCC MYA-4621 / FGSC 9543 / NRRL 43880) TaxID=246409 RepID=I1BTD3_RHIO9|nr:hypothetical protein RO3G_04168 [Rhizopus delemar RA 99-880]|eukprot:EIE79463.1 hypothetical protein RO3G_04168 [Rhizopus delemar RA 99-880]